MAPELSAPALAATTDLERIKSAAIDTASEGITISDARLPDNPLIFVNAGFSAMTGYAADEVVGRNCRFLQGEAKGQDGVKLIRQAIRRREAVRTEIPNYTKGGKPFWNRLSITPVFDAFGGLTHFIGIQEDITAQKEKAALEEAVARQAIITEVTLAAEEKLHREIGQELHDNVSQLLALAMLNNNRALKDPTSATALLEKNKSVIAEAIAELRRLSRSLVGPDMRESLAATVDGLVESLEGNVPFSIHFQYGARVEERLSQSRKLTLFRIIQEQLNNIIKYAAPRTVSIRLWNEGPEVCMMITDDGVGFDTATFREGIGLKNMRNRVERGRSVYDAQRARRGL